MSMFSDQEYEPLHKYQKVIIKTEFPEKFSNFQILICFFILQQYITHLPQLSETLPSVKTLLYAQL